MKYVVNFSAGLCSWLAARRVVEEHGPGSVTLLFADTRYEHPDAYRFLVEAAADVGAPLVVTADGRTPWQVFRAERFIGNNRIDPCSKILKRELLDRWHKEHTTPEESIIVVGLDWSEEHRLGPFRNAIAPWHVEAPMCDPPYLTKPAMMQECERRGLRLPKLYLDGFPHNNCGGRCVKQGQAGWKLLLNTDRAGYLEVEEEERQLRVYLAKDVSILRDRRGGTTRAMTLEEFRLRVEAGQPVDEFEWGGCGCAL